MLTGRTFSNLSSGRIQELRSSATCGGSTRHGSLTDRSDTVERVPYKKTEIGPEDAN